MGTEIGSSSANQSENRSSLPTCNEFCRTSERNFGGPPLLLLLLLLLDNVDDNDDAVAEADTAGVPATGMVVVVVAVVVEAGGDRLRSAAAAAAAAGAAADVAGVGEVYVAAVVAVVAVGTIPVVNGGGVEPAAGGTDQHRLNSSRETSTAVPLGTSVPSRSIAAVGAFADNGVSKYVPNPPPNSRCNRS